MRRWMSDFPAGISGPQEPIILYEPGLISSHETTAQMPIYITF
jgi:hypothetical protein